jgi:ABC-type Fe3+-hydroxamate transport system substrate-binding protein
VMAWGITPVACTRFCEQPLLPHVGGTKDPDVAAIVALQPDVVLVNDEENRRDDVDLLTKHGVSVHVTHVASLEDVAAMLRELAARLGQPAQCPEAIEAPPRLRARTFVLPIWRRPWMVAGPDTYGSSMLESLGWINACRSKRYPQMDIGDIAALGGEVVVAPSEPYPFTHRHRAELGALASKVVFVDGQDLLWWGARTPAARGRLAERLCDI